MTEEAVTMGRPKTGVKKVKRPPDARVAIIHLKGTAEYADWLEDFYRKTLLPKTTLVREGLKAIAKIHGFKKPPEL